MINHSQNLIDQFLKIDRRELLTSGKIGFERESLRIFKSQISKSDHPKEIGSKLFNQYITTDFSEVQLELVTPPLSDKTSALEFLDSIHHFVLKNLDNEMLWPFSMPPIVQAEKIPIADFGSSNLGLFKNLYRNGLAQRYGSEMQAISGVHYNYSFPDSMWQFSDIHNQIENTRESRSELYFRMLRNIHRMNWLLLYLFGASPALTKNFISKDKHLFKKFDDKTYYLPFATSLRMSEFGYCNLSRSNLSISTDSLSKYLSDLQTATNTLSKKFQIIDNDSNLKQITPNILQIEDEYYAVARAKSSIISNQKTISKLKEGGVDFIELRSLDLNPFSRTGIDTETVYFLEIFLIYCALKTSNAITSNETNTIFNNDSLVSKFGRDPNISLQKENTKIRLQAWGNEILDEMLPIAELLDSNKTVYRDIITSMKSKINNPSTTLSGRLLDKMMTEKMSFIDLGNSLGEKNREHYSNLETSSNQNWGLLEKEAKESWDKQNRLEAENNKPFENFIADYFKN